MSAREVYPIDLAGLQRELTLFEVKPGLKIAILNILGDTELVEACADALVKKTEQMAFDVLVTAESKSIPLVYAMSVRLKKPYVVLRKAYKFYMGAALKAETLSITTGMPQTLYLDEKDHSLMAGKRVMLLDDVISTGSTLEGMRSLMKQAGAEIVVEAAICTEGEDDAWKGIVSLAHLPLFTE